MHILLTGGTGLIGSALIAALGNEPSARFTVLSRGKHKASDSVRYVTAFDEIPFNTQFDAVLNLAGEPIADKKWSDSRKQKLLASRVQTTQDLINFIAMLDTTPKVLISGSAVGWYGNQGDLLVTEDSNPNDEFTHELCRLWEDAALAAERFGMRVCLLRTGLVIASNGGFLKRMLPPFKLCLGGRLGNGKQYMPWVHLDDIVEMIQFLITNTQCYGAYNATAPQPVTNSEFTKALGSALNRPTPFPVPEKVLKITLGEMSRLLLTGQNAVPEKFNNAGFTFRYPDVESALRSVV